MDNAFAGNAVSKRSEYDGVCRLCARDGVRDGVLLVLVLRFWLNPPVAAAALRSGPRPPDRVWKPVPVRDRPWQNDSASQFTSAGVPGASVCACVYVCCV